MLIDPVAPLFNITFALSGFIFCSRCGREPEYTSSHPQYTDENYYDLAVAMRQQGWKISDDDPLDVFCPQCAVR